MTARRTFSRRRCIRARDMGLAGTAASISGKNVSITNSGDLNNSGSIGTLPHPHPTIFDDFLKRPHSH